MPRERGNGNPVGEVDLRVHHVVPHFLPEIGGLEQSVARFALWQAEHGHEVVVHTSAATHMGDRLPPEDRLQGVLVRRYEPVVARGYYRSWFRPNLQDAEIVHLHGYAVRTNDYVARKIGRKPLLYSLHHGVQMPHPRRSDRILRALYDLLIGLPTLRRVDRILVAYRGDAYWLERHGIPDQKIRVVPTPLPDEAFEPGDPDWARSLVGNSRFFLYLGRLHVEKGVEDLLTALRELPEDVGLVYAGPDAGMLPRLLARAATLGVSDRTKFLGAVSEEQKRSLLAACASLVLPSRYEAQGLVVLEAWAQGRPVVTTSVGALSALVEDGSTGLLVPPRDSSALSATLRRIWLNAGEAEAMGVRGRRVAEEYRLRFLAARLDSIYQDLITT